MDTIHKSHNLQDKNSLKEYYKKWSNTYDSDVKSCEYNGPETITNILVNNFKIHGSHILDVGCGTGLIAEYLNKNKYQISIDGIDISHEMIEKAQTRNFYNNLKVVDVFDINKPQAKKYDFIISVGMFTHNHVGPTAIENILNYLDENGVFVFTVRNSYEEKTDFYNYIVELSKRGLIKKCQTIENQNYINEEKCVVYTLFI